MFITDAKSAARPVISAIVATTSPPSPATFSAKEENWTANPLNSTLDMPTAFAASRPSLSIPSPASPKVTRTALTDSSRSDAPIATLTRPAPARPANATAPAPNLVRPADILSSFFSALPSSLSAVAPNLFSDLTPDDVSNVSTYASRSEMVAMPSVPFSAII